MDDLKLIMEARQMIDAEQPLRREHLLALRPMFKILERKLKPRDPIPFIGDINSGFVVCSTPYGKLKGLGYAHQLLVQATNQIEESQSIPSVTLYSGGTMGKRGFYLFDTEPGVFDDNDDDDEPNKSSFQYAEWGEQEVSKEMLAVMEEDKKRLEDAGKTPETDKLLQFYVNQLKGRSYLGKPKPFDNDPERIRKNVEGSVRYAIEKLIDCEDTKHVGYHLKETIDLGIDCSYIGDWSWKLF